MIRHIRIARTLKKQLNNLRQTGTKGKLAATQCETLLDLIRHEGIKTESVYGKRTKKGECRISKCIKYDLGHGYRLVTIREGQDLFMTYIGNHDETDQWLDRHRYDAFTADDQSYIGEDICHEDTAQSQEGISDLQEEQMRIDPYEEKLLEMVDEALLKEVFQGLYYKQLVAE